MIAGVRGDSRLTSETTVDGRWRVIHAVPVNVWGHFATLGTAISLAYANLSNFRYRDKVRGHIIHMLREDGFRQNFLTYARNSPGSAQVSFLTKMGRLTPDDVGQGFDATAAATGNRWHSGMLDVQLFQHFYANNADKIVTAVLGIVASWVLWFGAIDELRFYEAAVDDATRRAFLSGAYIACTAILALALLTHLALTGKRLKWLGYLSIIAATIIFVRASCAIMWGGWSLAYAAQGQIDVWGNFAIGTFLLLTTAAPIVLVVFGDNLAHRMDDRADQCREDIGKANLGGASRATVTEPTP